MTSLSNRLFLLYVVLLAGVSGSLGSVFDLRTANIFNYYYSNLIIVSILLYSILFNERKVIDLFKKQLIIGSTIGFIALAVCERLERANIYFSFEAISWSGKEGILITIIFSFIASVIGLTLWYLKILVMKRYK